MHLETLDEDLGNITNCPPNVVWGIKIIDMDSISVGVLTPEQITRVNGEVVIALRSLVRISERMTPSHKPARADVRLDVIESYWSDETITLRCHGNKKVTITRKGILLGIISTIIEKGYFIFK